MWHKYLGEHFFLEKLYNEIPQLINVRISQLSISNEGNKVTLIFDMPLFANNPPHKWIENGYNTTVVQIDLFNVKEVVIKSISSNYKGNIDIVNGEDDTISVNISGLIDANIIAETGLIQLVDGYFNIPETD